MHFCSWCDKLHCPLGKIKTDNSIVFFPFHFTASSYLAGLFVPAEKECWYHSALHKHVAYVPRASFYTLQFTDSES